uniref:Uncharacterized protein n=1 Tax=Solanum lycopersicum TaxID=4081 RepID=A0A3Q7IU93_SOLLC
MYMGTTIYHLTRIEDVVHRIPSILWVWKSMDFQERESYYMF